MLCITESVVHNLAGHRMSECYYFDCGSRSDNTKLLNVHRKMFT